MDKTWASGAVELLRHADEHINNNTAFDKRIAFISIDNSVEISIRTYLSLPKQFFEGSRPSKDELEQISNSFSGLLKLLLKYAKNKLFGIEPGDIEHYHRIRNKLYHEGTGLSVDDEYLNAYFALSKILLKRLFDLEYDRGSKGAFNEVSLENVIIIWDQIEELIEEIFKKFDIDRSYTYKWEEIMRRNILNSEDINELTNIRIVRNTVVHSSTIDPDYLKIAIKRAENLKNILENRLK